MAGDVDELLLLYKTRLEEDKKRLATSEINVKEFHDKNEKYCDNEHQQNNNIQQSLEDKENQPVNSQETNNNNNNHSSQNINNLPLIERLDLSSNDNEGVLEEKRAFRSPDDTRGSRSMLRYGEYSPNNPQLRVSAAPYLGLGEYDQRRNYYQQKRKAEYLEYLSKVQHDTYRKPKNELNPTLPPIPNGRKFSSSYRSNLDQRLTSVQNALLKPEMDKPKSILSNKRTGSPRERLLSDLKHTYTPTFLDGFSYQDTTEELERERIKRENYQRELRLQIEEKRRLQAMREEQDRRERELENKRLEQQLLRMQEEQAIEEQRRSRTDEKMRRHSEDLYRRTQDLQSRFRKHTESESTLSSFRNTNVASKPLSHYSPPVTRRAPYAFNIPSSSVFVENSTTLTTPSTNRYNPNRRYDTYFRKDTLNRMDSLQTPTTYDTHRNRFKNAFSRYDSLSRIDTLNRQDTLNRIDASLNFKDNLSHVQRRHSATQQDLSCLRKSPKLQRRSSSSRFDDALPIPVLKAHSPVAKELKNSVPFNSNRSDAVKKLEDKWQIPAVQKNIMKPGDGQGRGILTQLGAIRMQLQQEQLRMDETLRKRDFIQSKAVDFH